MVLIILGAGIIGSLIYVIYILLKKDNTYKIIEDSLDSGDYQKALNLCLKKVDSQPNDFTIKYYIGLAYEGLKDYTQAILYLEKSSILVSGSDQEEIKVQIFIKTADLFKKMKKNEAALGYYVMALEKNPRNSKALLAAGELLYETKKYQKAKEYLENLIKVKPEDLRARFILAKIYIYLRNLSDATIQLEFILNNDKIEFDQVMLPAASFLLSDVYYSTKNFQKAIEVIRPLLDNENYYEEVLTKMIEIMIQCNQIKEAMELINTNMDNVSHNKKCELKYFLGSALFKNKEYFAAIKAWQEAHHINPKFRDLVHIYTQYIQIINNPKMEYIYSRDESKINIILYKLVHPVTINKIIKRNNFWAFKAAEFCYCLYTTPLQVPVSDLIEMNNIVLSDFRSNGAFTIFSLYGVVRSEGEGFDYKKMILISGDDFIKLINLKITAV